MTTRQTLALDGAVYETALTRKYALRKPYAPKVPGRVTAFIPGLILEVLVKPGDSVRRGQSLLVLEAMKMQNHVTAHDQATVKAVFVEPGVTVTKGQVLMELESGA